MLLSEAQVQAMEARLKNAQGNLLVDILTEQAEGSVEDTKRFLDDMTALLADWRAMWQVVKAAQIFSARWRGHDAKPLEASVIEIEKSLAALDAAGHEPREEKAAK